MTKFNLYKTGLLLGLLPIIGLIILFLIFWIGRALFAVDINVDGIGFLYIMISTPVVLVGFILTFLSLFKSNRQTVYKPFFGLILIVANVPILFTLLRTHGEISSRAYLKVFNNSEKDIKNISVKEPDCINDFGRLEKQNSKVIYYNPDYASKEGIQYAGISENYLVLTLQDKKINKKIPIIQPGEIHKLTIDNKFNLTDIHLNKIVFNK